ncbi:MAG: hypothetical protein BHW64_06475 [Candidatus Melainabacteria bacterium LEY3_CP_29_8]|nr:MAG: hypothetical protein BHW64_06475 [Candidatus Melainabacteria bacterium LEY3_CP_29_8]
MKKLLAILGLSCIFCSQQVMAAEKYGFVNLTNVMNQYNYAKNVHAKIQTQENEIDKFVQNAQQKMKNAKSNDEAKQIEESSKKELGLKIENLKKYSDSELQKIQTNINEAVKQVGKLEGYSLIVTDSSVLYGATDISTKVINQLNKK